MSNIQAIKESSFNRDHSLAQQRAFLCNEHAYNSTLVSVGSNSFFGCLTFPLRILGRIATAFGTFLRTYVFCCCTFEGEDQNLNWAETKEVFAGIFRAVIIGDQNGNPKKSGSVKDREYASDRQKKFNNAFSALSSAAQNRFREHIGFVLASKQSPPIKDRAGQEQWYQENRDKINFEDYFNNIDDPTNNALQAAVRNFQKELQEKTS